MNVRDLQHPLLPLLSEEDRSRQKAVVALRRLLNAKVRSGNVARFETEGAPAFAAAHGRQPQSAAEVQEALFDSPGYRLWSAMNRSAQEMIWASAGEPVYRDLPRIEGEAERLAAAPGRKGRLRLDPRFDPPQGVVGIDIHLQPGGYGLDRGEHDVAAGALYETGGNVFAFGQGVGRTDSKAGAIIRHLETTYPDFQPLRILDLGCSAGAATAAYAAHYPQAEVHGIDLGGGMLRYAHARAEALGVAVTFHQMNAADLAFADGSFDLVVSHNLLHEIGREERRAMFREALRVVRPGGIVVHQDVPTRFEPTLVQQVERAWDATFNGEAFWSVYSGDDLAADSVAAGAPAGSFDELRLPKLAGAGDWYVLLQRKAAA